MTQNDPTNETAGVIDDGVATAELLPFITSEHIDYLKGEGLPAQAAYTHGIYSITDGNWPEKILDDENRSFLAQMLGKRPVLIFPWKDPWREGEPVIQATPVPRGDWPKDKKYLFERKSGGVCHVSARDLEKIRNGTVKTVLVVEGTKQSRVAAAYVDDETVIVIGMPGCWGWRASWTPDTDPYTEPSGLTGPAPWLVGMLDEIKPERVVFLFDADYESNPDVNRAAELAGNAIEAIATGLGVSLPATTYANLADLGATGKAGFDDVLKTYPEHIRSGLINTLIAKSVPFKRMTKKDVEAYAKSRAAMDFRVDEEAREISYMGNPLTDWTARIANRRFLKNPLPMAKEKPFTELDVEMTFSDGATDEIEGLLESDFETLEWVRTAGDGEGAQVHIAPRMRDAIAAAIRQHRKQETIKQVGYTVSCWAKTATGWRFVLPDGAYGAQNVDRGTVARLNGKSRQMSLPDPSEASPDEIADSVRLVLDWIDKHNDETPAVAALGYDTLMLTGLEPEGSVMLCGLAGSGKSTDLGFLAARYGPFNKKTLDSFENSTKGIAARRGAGRNGLATIVDDYRPKAYGDDLNLILTAPVLIRIAYDGPAAAREYLEQSEKGGHREADIDWSIRGFLMGAEDPPPPCDATSSSLERALIIQFRHYTYETPENPATLKGIEAVNWIEDTTLSGSLRLGTAALLGYLARERDNDENYLQTMRDRRRELTVRGILSHVSQDSRSLDVLSGIVVGLVVWMDFAVEVGAIDQDAAAARLKKWIGLLRAASTHHIENYRFGERSPEVRAKSIVSTLFSQVADGSHMPLGGPVNEHDRRPVLMFNTRGKDGVVRVAVVVARAAKLLSMQEAELVAALRPSAFVAKGAKTAKDLSLGGVPTKSVVLNADAMVISEEDAA